SLLSAYQKATTKTVVANFILPLITANFADPHPCNFVLEILRFHPQNAVIKAGEAFCGGANRISIYLFSPLYLRSASEFFCSRLQFSSFGAIL
ncbi:MAG: hypothetical protein J6M12_03155, partial [Clostridia bacterium]|nr:hypothetical protein [Clostridia bacterium]